MTLTSWCAPPLPSSVYPPAFATVLCGLLKVAKLFASNQNQCRPPVAASCCVALLYLSLFLSLSLLLSLSFSLSCSSLGRSHSHSLPQAASCRRIVSYIKWLVSMLVYPLSLLVFDSLQCCVGCTHLARLPVWGNMMWQVLFAAALGPHFVRFVLRNC